jgi:DNA repair protein SbcC/Rad50
MISENTSSAIRRAFSRCEVLSPELLRCERRVNDRLRSVYFFDTSQALLSKERLSDITAKALAPSYFHASDESRWNQYFVWVVSDSKKGDRDVAKLRRAVEGDKDYARKFVIHESEVESFVRSGADEIIPAGQVGSMVDTWERILRDAGLSAVQGEQARAAVVRQIRSNNVALAVPPAVAPPPPSDAMFAKFLSGIDVAKFGTRALKGAFEFGRVTLIQGVNGTGKTSLLECLEHFYCGATRRSGGEAEQLAAAVTFEGDERPIQYQLESNQTYQARDLAWYGRTVNKGNALYRGFGRYNFLDTDAAVRFADETKKSHLNDLLAMVALGPGSSRIWARIQEFAADIEREATSLRNALDELKEQLDLAKRRRIVLEQMSPSAKGLLEALLDNEAVRTWHIARPTGTPEAEWFQRFHPLRTLLNRLREHPGISTTEELNASLAAAKADQQTLETLAKREEALAAEGARLTGQIAELERSLRTSERLAEFKKGGFLVAYRHALELEQAISQSRFRSTALPAGSLDALMEHPEKEQTVSKARDQTNGRLIRLRERQTLLSRQQSLLASEINEKARLLAHLRHQAQEFARAYHELDKCPACQTAMTRDEFLTRLAAASDRVPIEPFEKVTAEAAALQREIDKQAKIEQACSLVIALLPEVELMPLAAALAKTVAEQASLAKLKADSEQINSVLARLAGDGLTRSEYESLLATLKDDSPDMTQVIATISERRDELSQSQRALADIKSQRAAISLRYRVEAAKGYEAVVDRVLALTRLSDALASLPQKVREENASIKQLRSNLEQALDQLQLLSAAIKEEEGNLSELMILRDAITKNDERLSKEAAELRRLEAAENVLGDLLSNHSLEKGLASFFTRNFSAIQRIFARIHSPNELKLAVGSDVFLERTSQTTSEKVELSEISTGQRAAFVLSIFLLLNLSLRDAPRVMLIDDPIAHTDDLNSLSFLDFLADVAEAGGRQIFFATANEKLATLFAKKMAFLGEAFKTISMERAA